jgi:hypothetical protein
MANESVGEGPKRKESGGAPSLFIEIMAIAEVSFK